MGSRVLSFLVLSVLLAAPVWGETLAPRTLLRTEDTLVITGKLLGAKIRGTRKRNIRVYACKNGHMSPITFQIDERNRKGVYCWDQGRLDRRQQDEDKGLVDTNDELVVLVRDAGDRATNKGSDARGSPRPSCRHPVVALAPWSFARTRRFEPRARR